jgi:glycine cleavage system H protein
VSFLVLACTGLDKPEGSVAREVALQLAEEAGATIICPVALNRTPARYAKALAEGRVVVVDGCATRCATKLAKTHGGKISRVVLVAEAVNASGCPLPPDLRLGPDALDLARAIAAETASAEAAGSVGASLAEGTVVEPGYAPPSFTAPSDYLVVTHDKYEFRIPRSGFVFNANDVWAQVSGTRARVGISDYLQQRLTDIMFVDLPAMGAEVDQFGEVGAVESSKASFDLISPVSGIVVAVNDALADEPERVNQDPYESWIAELELTAWDEDKALLVDGAGYARDVAGKAAEQ